MKILIVNCVFDPEPIVSAQIGKSLSEELAERKHEVTVISPYPSRPNGFQFDEKFNYSKKTLEVSKTAYLKILKLPSFVYPQSNPIGRLWEGISFGWHCYNYIVKYVKQLDVTYMNTWPMFAQLGVAIACKKKNIPYTVHIQDLYPESLTKKLPSFLAGIIYSFLIPVDKYVLSNAHKVIAISEKMKMYLITTRKITADKITVVLNWQDESAFESYKNVLPESSKKIFMYLGNMGPVAGLPLLIEAFANAKIDAKLVLAGNGSKKEECVAIAKRCSEIDIEFWDVPSGQVAALQAKASVLLLPIIKGASSSSIPSKLPAYMFSSRPIIVLADNESDTANAVIKANCGWVGEAEDVTWLTEKMIEVNKLSAEELHLIGLNGRAFSLENFGKENNLLKLVNAIVE